MEAVQLFLDIDKPGLNNEWNSKLTASLKDLPSVEQVQVVEENEHSNAQISINYKIQELSINEIEKAVKDSGATITDINIHFPSDVSGVADPYGASAVATGSEDDLNSINGVLAIGVSSQGIIKATIDPLIENKQAVIENIISNASDFRH